MEFDIKIEGLKSLKRKLTDAAKKQIPFATSIAINKVAFIASKNIKGKMKQVFNSPTRFTLNSVLYEKSTKKKLFSRVYLADINRKTTTKTADYMRVQTSGGQRNLKGIESALSVYTYPYGVQTPYVMPAKGLKLDKYGNVPRGEWNRIISGLSLSEEKGHRANITPGSKKRNPRRGIYFRSKHGVMKRIGKRKIKPVLYFTDTKPKYKKRLPFHEVVRVTHKRHFNNEFAIALKRAMATARP